MVDLNRHSRHVLLPQVGAVGQAKISETRVLCVGAGGLGSPVIQYLAAAGIGHLTIIDDDRVDISNLQRQVIHGTSEIGILKAESALRFVKRLDPSISVDAITERLDESNAEYLFRYHDIIIDGTDNIHTRYIIDETCKNLGIPWVYGSVYRFEGQVSVFNYQGGPCYSDLFPEAPPPELIPSCSEAGVLGVLPGFIGCLQVNEALKIILEVGEVLSGKLLVYDALNSSQKTLKFGEISNKQIEESNPPQADHMFQQIDSATAIAKMKEGWSPTFYDVRSEQENSEARISKAAYLCPHTDVANSLDKVPKDSDILVHCRSGMRSQIAIMHLIQAGYDGSKLYNLSDGIIGWAGVDPEGIIHG
ncbi:MAG: HesA/MoeB/ThiF family protein [Candidatus Thermoplasmatota archaeon]|nr:HesA/MoeB/ThiF family protein [Candidatus Thermoplasmatota archaeon]